MFTRVEARIFGAWDHGKISVELTLISAFLQVGISWAGAGVPWYEAGAFSYFASTGSIWAVQVLMMSWAEGRRWMDMKNPGSVNKDPIFGNELPKGEVTCPKPTCRRR